MLTFRNEVCFYLAYTENIASADLTRFAPTAKIIIYIYFHYFESLPYYSFYSSEIIKYWHARKKTMKILFLVLIN